MEDKWYAVHPGWVTSKNDGDRHYVGYEQLIRLYGLDRQRCILWDMAKPITYRGRQWGDYTHCTPSSKGNYPLYDDDKEGQDGL